MSTHLELGVIGLGEFGLQLARTVAAMGHKVIGVDISQARVQQAQQELDQVYRADAAEEGVLRQLRFQDLDCAVVSVGEVELSLSITLDLQSLHLPDIRVRAVNVAHRKILARLGISQVILPEHDVAVMTAHRLLNPGLIDLIPKYGGIMVQELTVDAWAGKTLSELHLAGEYQILVLAIRRAGDKDFRFVPGASTRFERGDTLLVVGRLEDVRKLIS